ncbi:MAG: hypothetical protein IJR67_01610 [Acholeplasmatales bacterium]|nr:hypothetical protein [Acholeplasmatales bacterium]
MKKMFLFFLAFLSVLLASCSNSNIEITTKEDIYKLSEDSSNFSTIYVLNDGEVKFYENTHEHSLNLAFVLAECKIRDIDKIERINDSNLAISDLKTNDMLILYHDHKKEEYTNPAVKYCIRIFYVGTNDVF